MNRDEHIHHFVLMLHEALEGPRTGKVAQIWHEKHCAWHADDGICNCCPAMMIIWSDGARRVLNHDSTLHEFRHAA
jgi:hypothetical protein